MVFKQMFLTRIDKNFSLLLSRLSTNVSYTEKSVYICYARDTFGFTVVLYVKKNTFYGNLDGNVY